MAGYSGKPLAAKLGLKEGVRALMVGAPQGFEKTLGALPSGVALVRADKPPKGSASATYPFIHLFCRRESELSQVFRPLARALAKDGMFWISWPKQAALSKEDAKNPDTLDENKARALGLALGLVDVKVCAVDEVWSGLKFVFRRENR